MDQPLDFDATVEFMPISFLVGYDLAQEEAQAVVEGRDFFGELYGRND